MLKMREKALGVKTVPRVVGKGVAEVGDEQE